ncbi:MAG: hypothetical protein IPH08_10675 [Rhodocyclaceae bacterium]|nr:hypothetical protein [Rhodocyclaceae bacterium]MBK6907509.1 hypothetical protein [Rhodocyclaceae bacterium]
MAANDEELAQWAASFLAMCEEEPLVLTQADEPEDAVESLASNPVSQGITDAITRAAHDLLAAIDRGGVPAFMTSALKQIALDNGIALSALTTPNDIIDALRKKCIEHATSAPRNFE